ncbi:hypothetical protein ACOK4R_35185 (plasmid) [Pseudomonas fluorescens]|uniref:hypothetical protein n=2 Tax=Pseudomonas TaxID=286 RepID=UPI001F13B69E|nr:hypothetical protein [Pseudomonas viridiflava]
MVETLLVIEPMSRAISAIKSHYEASISGVSEDLTLGQILTRYDSFADKIPVSIPRELYSGLINELRSELMQSSPTTVGELLAVPTLKAWIEEGMGLAHSFKLEGESPTFNTGHPYPGNLAQDKFGDSLLEEMWRYIEWKPKSIPESAIRGILGDEGLITDLAGIVTGLSPMSLARCFGRSCPSILESRNWHHFEKAAHGHEKRKVNLRSGRTLAWLCILSFDNLGLKAYKSSANYARNHSGYSKDLSTLDLIINKTSTPEDTDLLDAFVEQVEGGWSSFSLNRSLMESIDANTFWRRRSAPEPQLRAMERFWLSRALRSLEGDKFHAGWCVNLAASIYKGSCPEGQSEELVERFGHLSKVMSRNPEMTQIFEYLNENAGWLISCTEKHQSDTTWADEAFLSLLDDSARNLWLDALSTRVSAEIIRGFKRNQSNFQTESHIAWFYKAQHPDYARLICDKMLKTLSFGRMSRDYPTAGTFLAQMATFDLRKPERKEDAINLVESVRSEKWKLFLIHHLGVSPSDVKLTGRQRDTVFAANLGI